jgi:hypothetical protein
LIRAAVGVLIVLPAALRAQHQHHADTGATHLGLSGARTASGTAWLPDAAPVPGYHTKAGLWRIMVHGQAFIQYLSQTGTRADGQLGSVNWVMAMFSRTWTRSVVRLRLMATAEPYTVTARGYPQLLQVAHPYQGVPVQDRQHPHELFAELSAAFEHAVSDDIALSLYAAPIGEPALGPVAYGHRPSAAYEPTAPLGHVAQDYTHESLGVVTVGVFAERVRVEASLFNGSHPDDERTNFDLQGGRLDSYAGRITLAPSARVAASAWAGYVAADPEHSHGAVQKFGATLLHSRPRPGGHWSSAVIYAALIPRTTPRRARHTLLLESSLDLSTRHAVFGRAEYVRRTAGELALIGSVPAELDLGAISLGYAWRPGLEGVTAAAGARLTLHVVPRALEPFYGSRTPAALLAFVRLSPPAP